MTSEIQIPKGKKNIAVHRLKSPTFRAPDGSELSVYVPQRGELTNAWKVLEDYTRRVAPNPESALQDLDDIRNVREYHFGKDLGYLVFTAIDQAQNPVAMVTAEILPASELVDGRIARGKGIGFIYQIAHTPEISRNDRDFSVATKLYRAVSGILPEISKYQGNDWLGVVTESRNKGPELKAIKNAGFKDLVPNEDYRPPAVQEVEDPRNRFTRDLVLLGKGIPRNKELRQLTAEAYVNAAYCEGQDVSLTLDLMSKYFSKLPVFLLPFMAAGYAWSSRGL